MDELKEITDTADEEKDGRFWCACVCVRVGDGFVCVRFDSDWYGWED